MPSDELEGANPRAGCHTVNCSGPPTKKLRMENEYESVTGETRSTVLEKWYCDEHAEMWLDLDRMDGRSYEVIDEMEVP